MTLAEIIQTGMNNPDCSFFVGAYIGQISAAGIIFYVLGALAIFKVIEKLALDPLLDWIRSKVHKLTASKVRA